MVDIAKRYNAPHKEEYLDAVLQFRLPFWDYYRPRGGPVTFPGVIDRGSTSFPYDYSLPRILTEPKVFARFYPDNEQKQLEQNPFQFHAFDEDESAKIEWDVFAISVRFQESELEVVIADYAGKRIP